jgi:hypothetical protein
LIAAWYSQTPMDGEKFAGSNGMWFLVVAKPKDS